MHRGVVAVPRIAPSRGPARTVAMFVRVAIENAARITSSGCNTAYALVRHSNRFLPNQAAI